MEYLPFNTLSTSKHLSVGTYALVSLMVYSTISRIESEHSICSSNLNVSLHQNLTNLDSNDCKMRFKLDIATSLAFWCGIVQVIY